jgi:thiosulfate/3-mercaptopyruvate sulfurtransferase
MAERMYTTLIQADELQALMRQPAPVMVFDCSFDLSNAMTGHEAYLQAHIPGARHVDLNINLSAAEGQPRASGGRHPLPTAAHFAQWLGQIGLSNDMQAVVYDRNNSSFAPRMWWMLKWVGHDGVALLDGGLKAWQAAQGALESVQPPAPIPAPFELRPALRELLTVEQVLQDLGKPAQNVIDARARPRYLGEVEPLDPVAGHIPGALNRPYTDNLDATGRFLPASELRAAFERVLAGRDPQTVVHQCGSGVTAIPNLLAMEIAGLGHTRLFAGSWSEWCRDTSRPVARG